MKSKNTKLQNNEERKARKNSITGLVVLLVIVAVFSVFVYLFGVGIANAIEWLSNVASKLDAVVIVALISGTVALILRTGGSKWSGIFSLRFCERNIARRSMVIREILC